ncbi:MAG: 30S ribosomal protein S20 [Candidatus Omnitrophica bacterium]|nr:30S ribosomal protein S20 [Candidatus Omnitrophota bacterium]
MPRRKTSLKRTRANKKRRIRNIRVNTQIKKSIKKFQMLVEKNQIDEAKKFLPSLASVLDKAAKKGIIPQETSDRRKSRLTKRVNKKASAS